MGRLIVFDGLDASGKKTQAELLKKKLEKEGKSVKLVSYPNYGSDSSFLVRLYLNGDIEKDPFFVNPYIATSFYAADHYITYKKCWQEAYNSLDFIICDRYVSSNAVHQMAKLEKKEWGSFLSWLYDFEFIRVGLPKEDILIYLDVEPYLSQNLMKKRSGFQDIHEKNLNYLKLCRKAAFYSAEKLGWHILSCNSGDYLLPIKEISMKIYNILFKNLW